jgi:hypothetical protein
VPRPLWAAFLAAVFLFGERRLVAAVPRFFAAEVFLATVSLWQQMRTSFLLCAFSLRQLQHRLDQTSEPGFHNLVGSWTSRQLLQRTEIRGHGLNLLLVQAVGYRLHDG